MSTILGEYDWELLTANILIEIMMASIAASP
jgi:hypothetical protein